MANQKSANNPISMYTNEILGGGLSAFLQNFHWGWGWRRRRVSFWTGISPDIVSHFQTLKHRDSFGKEKKNHTCFIFDKTLFKVFLNNFPALNRS